MTQPCQHCGQPSETPSCLRCQASIQRLGSDGSDHRLALQLSETRKHLAELPDLFAQLALFRLPGSAPKDPDQRGGKSNPSHRSVLNLDVVDLTDTREKANAEPTRTDYDLDRRAGARRQGVLPTLASWSRLVDSELWDAGIDHEEQAAEATVSGECGYLLRHMSWIGQQQWFGDLHDDVDWLREDVRKAIGDRDWVKLRCRYCKNLVHPVDAAHKPTSWEACAYGKCEACDRGLFKIGPELAALGKVQDSLPLDMVSKTLGIPLPTLYRWWKLGIFEVAPESPKRPSNRKPAVFDLATVREKLTLLRSA